MRYPKSLLFFAACAPLLLATETARADVTYDAFVCFDPDAGYSCMAAVAAYVGPGEINPAVQDDYYDLLACAEDNCGKYCGPVADPESVYDMIGQWQGLVPNNCALCLDVNCPVELTTCKKAGCS